MYVEFISQNSRKNFKFLKDNKNWPKEGKNREKYRVKAIR